VKHEYPLKGNVFDLNKAKRMFNLVGIGSLCLYVVAVIYNWVVLNIVPNQPQDLVLWVLGGLYLLVKIYGIFVNVSIKSESKFHRKEMERMERELKELDVEERKRAIERQKDFDDNQIT
jgi:hypothetical protein